MIYQTTFNNDDCRVLHILELSEYESVDDLMESLSFSRVVFRLPEFVLVVPAEGSIKRVAFSTRRLSH